MRRRIVINFQHEGLHCWPECNVSGVEFLKNPHRHLFYIRCIKTVTHNDRDIEIIDFKRTIQEYLGVIYGVNLGAMSCEDLAEQLLRHFELDYCRVLEDGENGAEVFI